MSRYSSVRCGSYSKTIPVLTSWNRLAETSYFLLRAREDPLRRPQPGPSWGPATLPSERRVSRARGWRGEVGGGGQTSPSQQVRAADPPGQVWAASRVGGAWRRPPGGAAPLPAVPSRPPRVLRRPSVPTPNAGCGASAPRTWSVSAAGEGAGVGTRGEGESRPCCMHVPCGDASASASPNPRSLSPAGTSDPNTVLGRGHDLQASSRCPAR